MKQILVTIVFLAGVLGFIWGIVWLIINYDKEFFYTIISLCLLGVVACVTMCLHDLAGEVLESYKNKKSLK